MLYTALHGGRIFFVSQRVISMCANPLQGNEHRARMRKKGEKQGDGSHRKEGF